MPRYALHDLTVTPVIYKENAPQTCLQASWRQLQTRLSSRVYLGLCQINKNQPTPYEEYMRAMLPQVQAEARKQLLRFYK